MLRIGICDDEAVARLALRLNIEGILTHKELAYTFFEFSSGEGALQWCQKHPGGLDVLFLDIEMNGMNGMDTARALRAAGYKALLVFATGYADYVFDGYEVAALDYLLKPVKSERVESVLQRVLLQLQKQSREVYTLHNTEGVFRVFYDDILYFYSDKRQVKLVTATQEYAFYARLDEVAQSLEEGFLRIHQRYLVRLEAAGRLQGNTLYVGEAALPVSRALKASVTTALARNLLNGGSV